MKKEKKIKEKKVEEGIIELEIDLGFYGGSPYIIAFDENEEVVASGIEHAMDEALDNEFLPRLREFLLKAWEKYEKNKKN